MLYVRENLSVARQIVIDNSCLRVTIEINNNYCSLRHWKNGEQIGDTKMIRRFERTGLVSGTNEYVGERRRAMGSHPCTAEPNFLNEFFATES